MSTYDEALHPRSRTGQYTNKIDRAPNGQLMDDIMGPDTLVGNYVNADRLDGADGVVEITEAEFTAGEVKDATELQVGDQLLWRSVTDHGQRYFAETVTWVQVGVNEKFQRTVIVETPRRPGGRDYHEFRGTQAVGVRAVADTPVTFPPLRDGHSPEALSIVVESTDEYGSTVALRRAGTFDGDPLDRFRVTAQLPAGTMPLLEADSSVQATVADRFIPLAGLSMDEHLRREPIGHGGRAWND